MPNLSIEREHALGLAGARALARRWREQAEQEWGMVCTAEPAGAGESAETDEASDLLRFARSGVSGELRVSETRLALNLKLGFLLGAYSERIEAKIKANLDELLGPG